MPCPDKYVTVPWTPKGEWDWQIVRHGLVDGSRHTTIHVNNGNSVIVFDDHQSNDDQTK